MTATNWASLALALAGVIRLFFQDRREDRAGRFALLKLRLETLEKMTDDEVKATLAARDAAAADPNVGKL